MANGQGAAPAGRTTLIEIKLNSIQQLFNSLDPSPFHEKDLDHDAESYIVDWALESPREHPVALLLHLPRAACGPEQEAVAGESIRNYFAYRIGVITRQNRLLFEQGRLALLTGLAFLALCLLAQHFLASLGRSGLFWEILEEGFLISGWVAMWKPIDIFLYQWWPHVLRRRVYRKLAVMPVELRPCD